VPESSEHRSPDSDRPAEPSAHAMGILRNTLRESN